MRGLMIGAAIAAMSAPAMAETPLADVLESLNGQEVTVTGPVAPLLFSKELAVRFDGRSFRIDFALGRDDRETFLACIEASKPAGCEATLSAEIVMKGDSIYLLVYGVEYP